MSIIYQSNSNETILIPKIIEKALNRNRYDSTYNYEVLLPVVFIIIFILVLFLVYAYNNLNLKQFIIDRVLCCCVSARRRRRRRWRYAQYNPNLHSSQVPPFMTNDYVHSSRFQKPFGPNQTIIYNQNQIFDNTSNVRPSINVDTRLEEGSKRPENIYYPYTGVNYNTNRYPSMKMMTNQPPQFYWRARDGTIVQNYDQIFFSSVPNYVYKLNRAYESGSSASSDLVGTSISDDNRVSRNHHHHQQQRPFNPFFSGSDRNRRAHQINGYFESHHNRDVSSGPRNSLMEERFSPVVSYKMRESIHQQESSVVSSTSSRIHVKKKLFFNNSNDIRNSVQLKHRSSTVKTLNTTAGAVAAENGGYHELSSWNRSSSRQSIKSRRLFKMSNRLKNLSSDASLLKSLCREIKTVATSDYDNLSGAHDNSLSSSTSQQKNSGYARLCKSFSFLTSQSCQKRLLLPPNISEQQKKLNINHDFYFSEPSQLNSSSSSSSSSSQLQKPDLPNKQDACVQTSSTNFSTESASVNNETNTMMQSNTFGSIMANLGSASIRPSSMVAPKEGLFEINRVLVRHRAFSDGQGLSNYQGSMPPPIHHSVSSSKLFYKRF